MTLTLHEVGPRDGLQNEPRVIATAQKVALIDLLATSGLRHIEVGSFVSPKWVPQMADTAAVMAVIAPNSDCQFSVLVPNLRGWQGFVSAADGLDNRFDIAVFVAASEGFSRANLNTSIAESLTRTQAVVSAAQSAGVRVRGYVSCVTDCPYDGVIAPRAVADVVAALRGMDNMQVSLGDTIGAATPDSVNRMLDAVLKVCPAQHLAGHFHDTGGRALDNIAASAARGITHFDSAVGGLGGCPYAPGAPGNVATEAVLARFDTGLNARVIAQAATMAKDMRKDA